MAAKKTPSRKLLDALRRAAKLSTDPALAGNPEDNGLEDFENLQSSYDQVWDVGCRIMRCLRASFTIPRKKPRKKLKGHDIPGLVEEEE